MFDQSSDTHRHTVGAHCHIVIGNHCPVRLGLASHADARAAVVAERNSLCAVAWGIAMRARARASIGSIGCGKAATHGDRAREAR